MPNKLTDKEIVKALECCGRNSIAGWLNDCKNCPLNDRTTCIPKLMYKSKDLINRLQSKNKELDEKLVIYKGTIDWQAKEINRLQAENKEQEQAILNALNRIKEVRQTAKAEAYKEFAERLKNLRFTGEGINGWVVNTKAIDNLLKEKIGE